MKIMTLLFLSLYSLHLRVPHFLGPHDTLLCILITQWRYFQTYAIEMFVANFLTRMCVDVTQYVNSEVNVQTRIN